MSHHTEVIILTTSPNYMKRKINHMLVDYYRICQMFEQLQADSAVHTTIRAIYLKRAACYDDLIQYAESCANLPGGEIQRH